VLTSNLTAGVAPPGADDEGFWDALATKCHSEGNDDVTMSASELAQDVIAEFESARHITSGVDGITCGDLGCAESRLVSALYGLKGVIFIASHPMEPLWGSDGIQYHTVTISPAIEPSKTLSSQLLAACAFIRAHRPVLLCSSCPALPALVLAAYAHRESYGRLPIREALASAERSLGLAADDVSAQDAEELEAFAQLHTLSPPPPPLTLVAPPPTKVAANGCDTDSTSSCDGADEGQVATPRTKVAGDLERGLRFSSDSTSTQVDAELVMAAETPTKHAAAPAVSDEEASPSGRITRRGQQKRDLTQDAARLATDNPTSPKLPKKLERGTCTTCLQVDVLGWPMATVALPTRFQCCACHDANDANDV